MPIFAPSTVLNKYRVMSEIGQGGMGRVWQAEEITFGNRAVAIKESRTDLPAADLEDVKRRYLQEVQVYAALQKVGAPNLVPVYTVELYEDNELLVMTYMPGGDLDGLLRQYQNGLSVEQALVITIAVLEALQVAHEHPMEIVHRDVKPSNILFDAAGKSYLADFGLAQLAGSSGRSQLQLQVERAHPGTPAYMAPEQANTSGYLTPAADIYAVSCVFFEMLTGKRYKRVRPGTTASSLRSDIPAWVDEIVNCGLAEDRFDRYEDAGQMLGALNAGMAATATKKVQPQSQMVGERKQQIQAERKKRDEETREIELKEEQRLQSEAEQRRQVEIASEKQMDTNPIVAMPEWTHQLTFVYMRNSIVILKKEPWKTHTRVFYNGKIMIDNSHYSRSEATFIVAEDGSEVTYAVQIGPKKRYEIRRNKQLILARTPNGGDVTLETAGHMLDIKRSGNPETVKYDGKEVSSMTSLLGAKHAFNVNEATLQIAFDIQIGIHAWGLGRVWCEVRRNDDLLFTDK